MSISTYKFSQQLAKAETVERELDEYFQGQGIKVHPASSDAQRAGIDRWFRMPLQKGFIPVEYKADWKASETGNVFVELISVLRGASIDALGWAYSSQADWLFYCLPAEGYALHIEFAELRKHLAVWVKQFQQRTIKNEDTDKYSGYQTTGLLVPMMVFSEISRPPIKLNFG